MIIRALQYLSTLIDIYKEQERTSYCSQVSSKPLKLQCA